MQRHTAFWSAFPKWWSIVTIWFRPGPSRWKAIAFVLASVAMCATQTALIVTVSYRQRDFSSALSEKDAGVTHALAQQLRPLLHCARLTASARVQRGSTERCGRSWA